MSTLDDDAERRARDRLPPHVAAYYAVGAGSAQGLTEGTAEWSAVRFRPRVLTDVSAADTGTTVLGTPVGTPVLVAPMAQLHAAHPDGEAAVARAVAEAGSLLGVSTHTAIPFDTIAATGAPWWFQVYVMRDHDLTALLVRRAVAAGARALILTADMIALLPGTVNPRDWPDGPDKARLSNLTAAELAGAGPDGIRMDPALSPATIGWLRELSGLPVLVKGVLRADDARRCLDAGAAGVVVSTHGGRRMGASIGTARALPEVVDAAGPAEVYVDSGLRTAEHVAAALAMGARGVFLGRPVAWALAADGPPGVRDLLTRTTADLRTVLTQLGVAAVADLTSDLIAAQLPQHSCDSPTK